MLNQENSTQYTSIKAKFMPDNAERLQVVEKTLTA
jgi:hypothetical protein